MTVDIVISYIVSHLVAIVVVVVVVVAQAFITGFLASAIAFRKGHLRASWFAIGFCFGLLGLIAAAGLPDVRLWNEIVSRRKNPSLSKTCPRCAEKIRPGALVCHYCGNEFTSLDIAKELAHTLQRKDPNAQRNAIMILSKIDDKSVVPFLIESLSHCSAKVCLIAIEALCQRQVSDAGPAFMNLLLRLEQMEDCNDDVKRLCDATVKALEKFGDTSLVPDLSHFFDSIRESDRLIACVNKKQIIRLLAVLGQSEAVPFLVGIASHDTDVENICEEVITDIGPDALPHLNSLIKTSRRKQRKKLQKMIKIIDAANESQ